ncbi:hypothetical protein JKP88DRAFT_225609 [Tribonema minus]|uniref:Uncharacterized protein n=1 Tax=Tribonema minus TaxID=303371 RepID=A0A835YPA5_9STRA|nr:hypothetical protein JKP88DRAFT_225609 [Tribonema minus]
MVCSACAVAAALALTRYLLVAVPFSGDPIVMRSGMVVGNSRWISSRTHHLHMQRDGSVVLAQGTRPASEQVQAPLWSTGRPFEDRDCQKCVIRVAIDAQGAALQVLEGRQLVKSVQLSGHPLLAAALQIKGPDDDRP